MKCQLLWGERGEFGKDEVLIPEDYMWLDLNFSYFFYHELTRVSGHPKLPLIT